MDIDLIDEVEEEEVDESIVLESEKTASETASLLSRFLKKVKQTEKGNSVTYEQEYDGFVFCSGINNFQVTNSGLNK